MTHYRYRDEMGPSETRRRFNLSSILDMSMDTYKDIGLGNGNIESKTRPHLIAIFGSC